MKKSRLLLVIALLAGALLVVPGLGGQENEEHVAAQDSSEQAEQPAEQAPENSEGENGQEAEAPENQDQASEQNSNTYNYVAQEGDSYSVLARKAVQTYGIVNGVNLSGAEIVFAETKLTQQAGSPVLNAGQEVSIAESDVKQWVDAAQALTDEEEAGWDYYVQFVDFNTDAAGEPQS